MLITFAYAIPCSMSLVRKCYFLEDQLGFDNYTKEVLKGRVSSRNSGKGGQNDVGWKCGGATVCGAVHARLDS